MLQITCVSAVEFIASTTRIYRAKMLSVQTALRVEQWNVPLEQLERSRRPGLPS